tara:strand:- start:4927 stop:5823 length:897 start_codon:yes stop_codon:yes gene_type:complete
MRVFDTFMFYNELDLLEIRLQLLYPYVDYFIISECNETFSGKRKEFIFQKNKERFKKYQDKIIYQQLDQVPSSFEAFSKPFYTNYSHSYAHKHNGVPLISLSKSFQREVYQRDSVIEPLLKLADDNDIILMSDLDEIPNPSMFSFVIKHVASNNELVHFEQSWFMYYLNNYCDNKWYGTHVCKFSFLLNYSVDLLQYHKEDPSKLSGGLVVKDSGWHFSFLGGGKKVKEKLRAYDYQGGRTSVFLSLLDRLYPGRLQKKILNNKDIFLTNRVFYKKDLSELFSENLVSIMSKFPIHIR